MKYPIVATEAPALRHRFVDKIALVYAGFIVVMLLTQLFTFESWLELVVAMDITTSLGGGYLIAGLVVGIELLALPFLLRMYLSPAFRWLSMIFGWLVGALWLFFSQWTMTVTPEFENVGFFGTIVEISPGWWAIVLSFVMLAVSSVIIWGMGPELRRRL
ncbi:hypothetical protein B7Y94_05100 [Candidatus Saccharibacteria bacterium 32-49-12]|nr:MAG: hypothetical protein B7Y94_05100 [Candidatus Saccharibacteria bacterium 32-49-12]